MIATTFTRFGLDPDKRGVSITTYRVKGWDVYAIRPMRS